MVPYNGQRYGLCGTEIGQRQNRTEEFEHEIEGEHTADRQNGTGGAWLLDNQHTGGNILRNKTRPLVRQDVPQRHDSNRQKVTNIWS
jgi:hypothetical protein